MKDEMRKYFPERFADANLFSTSTFLRQMDEGKLKRRRAECEARVAHVFEQSNELNLLKDAMKKYGCNFTLARHVACELCNGCHGGYDPDTNQIIICQNQVLGKHRILSTLAHEMIHMFDYCRAKFDFDNLEHIACSEIRAANLTYCAPTDRLRFGGILNFDFKNTHRYCVQDVAFQSVKAYSPETEDSKIWQIIDKVFPGCYNDLEPFGRRPINDVRAIKQSYRERYYYGYA